jgi:transposase-like protein
MVRLIRLPRCPHCGASQGHIRRGPTLQCRRCKRRFYRPLPSWTDREFWRRPLSAEDLNRWAFWREQRKRLITSLQALGQVAKTLWETILDFVCPRCGGRAVRDGQIRGKARRRCRNCGYRYVAQARWRRLERKRILLPRCPYCGASGDKVRHVRWIQTKTERQVYRCGKRGCRRYFVWPIPVSAENPNRWELWLITSLQTIGQVAKALWETILDFVCPRCGGRAVRDGQIRGKARRRCRKCGYQYVAQT